MPYPSTLTDIRQFRLQQLLNEAARERLAALAVQTHVSQEERMFGEHDHDSIVRRGIDEALACQDVLARAPIVSSPMARLGALFVALPQALARRVSAGKRRSGLAIPRTATRRTSLPEARHG
jgi:hypothetical protein